MLAGVRPTSIALFFTKGAHNERACCIPENLRPFRIGAADDGILSRFVVGLGVIGLLRYQRILPRGIPYLHSSANLILFVSFIPLCVIVGCKGRGVILRYPPKGTSFRAAPTFGGIRFGGRRLGRCVRWTRKPHGNILLVVFGLDQLNCTTTTVASLAALSRSCRDVRAIGTHRIPAARRYCCRCRRWFVTTPSMVAVVISVRFVRPMRPMRSGGPAGPVAPSRPDALAVGVGLPIIIWVAVPPSDKLLHHAALAHAPIAQDDQTDDFGRIRRGTGRRLRRWFRRWCGWFVVAAKVAQQNRPGEDAQPGSAQLLGVGRHESAAAGPLSTGKRISGVSCA